MLTVIVITGLIGILALSVDVGFIFSFRTQYQNGIEAAALAGASGLRVAIEDGGSMPQQEGIVKELAVRYAGLNQVRRYSEASRNFIELNPGNVKVDIDDQDQRFPTVTVNSTLNAPTFFGGAFGFNGINVNAASTASLFPVDGGTGTIGACWRPIFLPDSFYDQNGRVHYVGDETRAPLSRKPGDGDYYRSRFAIGARLIGPFIDGAANSQSPVTGLRDTEDQLEIGQRTIMGLDLSFRRDSYFVADFSNLPRASIAAITTQNLGENGHCGQIGVYDPLDPNNVGNELPVYQPTNDQAYNDLRRGLENLRARNQDSIDDGLRLSYRYIKSNNYQDPNSHGLIIPVLLFDPFLAGTNPGRLRVTNIGLFFLDRVTPEGTLQGFFVREIMSGGTAIARDNFSLVDQANAFRRRWLPMSVRLLK